MGIGETSVGHGFFGVRAELCAGFCANHFPEKAIEFHGAMACVQIKDISAFEPFQSGELRVHVSLLKPVRRA
jgi:hypothetical protein